MNILTIVAAVFAAGGTALALVLACIIGFHFAKRLSMKAYRGATGKYGAADGRYYRTVEDVNRASYFHFERKAGKSDAEIERGWIEYRKQW